MAPRGDRRRLPRVLGRSARARRRRLAFLGMLAALLVAGLTAAAGLGPGVLRVAEASAEKAHPQAPAASAARPSGPAPAPAASAPPLPSPAAPSSPAPPPIPAQPAWQEMPASIAGTVSQFVSSRGAAGAAVAVSTGTGATARARYLATVGQAADGTPWSADMRSAFRSITKSFVGTAVLQLVAQGRLGL
ncbi:serine hydrolase, partial [Sinomonas atrocyanea]|uniref:serine hydrolase n=1 Tax=Sinomonas atrocyanea TaxID=37927 RepID=UPI00278A1918